MKRRDVKRTRLSSTLCVRLHPLAGWLQGSPCRRFLLPPAFHFAGAEVLPGSGLGNRSSLRSSRSDPAGVCPACGHIHFASFYLLGDFVPHIRIMNTGYQTASLGNLFGLPYVVMRKTAPIDTTTLNYNGRSGRPMRSAFIPRKRTKLTSRAHRKPLLPCAVSQPGRFTAIPLPQRVSVHRRAGKRDGKCTHPGGRDLPPLRGAGTGSGVWSENGRDP